MEQFKFNLMQVALELFKTEISRGNQAARFMEIYKTLKAEIFPQTDQTETKSEE